MRIERAQNATRNIIFGFFFEGIPDSISVLDENGDDLFPWRSIFGIK